jgi:hypothetical protein
MSKNNNIPGYNLADVQRYLAQQMSSQEMHNFEQAMLTDPLLADAFEGFMQANMQESTKQTSRIKEQILAKTRRQSATVIPMASRRFNWLRVAAAVLLLAGAGTVTYKLMQKPANNQLANIIPTTTPSIIQAPVGSNTPNIVSSEPGSNTDAKLLKSPSKKMVELAIDSKDPDGTMSMIPPVKESFEAESRAFFDTLEECNQKTRIAMADIGNELRGRVINHLNQPIRNANITINNRNVALTDQQGNFYFNSPDTAVPAEVVVNGYSNTNITLRSRGNNLVQLPAPNNNQTLADVVVLEEMSTKKTATTASSTKVNLPTANPSIGWEEWKKYIAANKNTTATGTVTLQFSLNDKGKPRQIVVVGSTNTQLNAIAIQLLQNGGVWKQNQKQVHQTTIEF